MLAPPVAMNAKSQPKTVNTIEASPVQIEASNRFYVTWRILLRCELYPILPM